MKKIIQNSTQFWKISSIFVLMMLFLWGFNLQSLMSSKEVDLSENQIDEMKYNENIQRKGPISSSKNVYQIISSHVWKDIMIKSVWTDNTSIYECGSYSNNSNEPYDFFLAKRDLEGNQIWNRTDLGINKAYGEVIWGDETGLYVELNSSLLCKFDNDGNLLWNITLPNHIIPQSSLWGDGTFIYNYGQYISALSDSDLYLLKINQTGYIVENRTWQNSPDIISFAHGIYGTGNALITIETYYQYPYEGYTLRKWNINGESFWNTTWIITDAPYLYDVSLIENSIYITGRIYYHVNGVVKTFITKWNLDGHQEWIQYLDEDLSTIGMSVYGNEDTIFGVFQKSICPDNESQGLVLIAWDMEGSQLWSTFYEGVGVYYYNLILFGNERYLFIEGRMLEKDNWNLVSFQIKYELQIDAPILYSVFQDSIYPNYIRLNWNEIPNATCYYIYRETFPFYSSQGLIPIYIVHNPRYTDYLVNEGAYFYGITAVNDSGESPLSNCIGLFVYFDIDAPYINYCIFYKSSKQVYLDWNDVDGANYYVVYRSESYIYDLTYLNARVSTVSSAYYDSVTYSGTYHYVVVAVRDSGESEISNQVSVYVDLSTNTWSPYPTTTHTQPTNIPSGGIGFVIALIFILALIFGLFALSRASDEQKSHPTSKPTSTLTSTSYKSTYDKSLNPALSKNIPLTPMKIRFCPQCGTPCEPFGNFCAECGSKLN